MSGLSKAEPGNLPSRPNNHALRSERYRYIRYYDGTEELYDMKKDPNEWKNLAAGKTSSKHQKIIDELAAHLPEINHEPRKATRKKKKR